MNNPQNTPASRPNILLIMTDQQRFDMLSINGGQSKSPALERFLSDG
jgi:arylsulfatase A-like enzyme